MRPTILYCMCRCVSLTGEKKFIFIITHITHFTFPGNHFQWLWLQAFASIGDCCFPHMTTIRWGPQARTTGIVAVVSNNWLSRKISNKMFKKRDCVSKPKPNIWGCRLYIPPYNPNRPFWYFSSQLASKGTGSFLSSSTVCCRARCDCMLFEVAQNVDLLLEKKKNPFSHFVF